MHSIVHHDNPALSAHGDLVESRAPGIILALLACLPIAGTLLIAQVLPQMEEAFTGTADLRLKVSIALTVPALAIAVSSGCVGWLADRMGKRRLLLVALFFYAIFGLSPLILKSLEAIIAVRSGMGLAEGVIITCSTALIGDLYTQGRREGLLSLQTACASIAAVAFAMIGGALGELGWRAPFMVYGLSLLFVPAVFYFIPNVEIERRVRALCVAPLPWRRLLIVCVTTVIFSLCFYVAQIQTPYLLNAIGKVSPATVGLVSAITNSAVVAGSFCFVLIRRWPLSSISLVCFTLIAVGLGLAAYAKTYPGLVLGLVMASFAGGIALPNLVTGAMALLTPEQRGLGAGLWQSSFWSGQFFSPVLVICVTAVLGGLTHAVGAFSFIALVVGGSLSLLIGSKFPKSLR
ncbi:MFS transporter [Novosphingobium sp.]|uniref:MFS transporter n=1 Tax=Novosphingobium sp. TaxID=1874826 RepID=UPI002FE1E682